MMDWVGVFNAYSAGGGGPRQQCGSNKNLAGGMKRSSSARMSNTSANNRNQLSKPGKPIVKSASAACMTTTTIRTTKGVSFGGSVLARSNSNENREGIFRPDVNSANRPRSSRLSPFNRPVEPVPSSPWVQRDSKIRLPYPSSPSLSNTTGSHPNSQGPEPGAGAMDERSKEKNVFEKIKSNLINSFLRGVAKRSSRIPAKEQEESQTHTGRKVVVDEAEAEMSRKLSQNLEEEEEENFPNSPTTSLTSKEPNDKNTNNDDSSAAEAENNQSQEIEIAICTCELYEEEEEKDNKEDSSAGTMPRNTNNHYVHPKYQLPPANSTTSTSPGSHIPRCKVHYTANARKYEPIKGRHHPTTRDHNQNNQLCNHHHKTGLQNGIAIGDTEKQQSKRKDSTTTMTTTQQGPILPPIPQQKKEYIPHFILLDACKSVNERKIIELVKKLSTLPSDEVAPIANFQDQAGRTPLSYTCSAGNVGMVEELSKLRRLDPNLADTEGNTPLHYAAQAGHSEVVDLIFSRFNGVVELNCRNSIGLTPLMKAALQGRTRCTKSLISAGADPYLRDYSRQLTADGWARLCGRHICAEVIVRSSKDYFHRRNDARSSADSSLVNGNSRIPQSKSDMELKRMNSDESPYYHIHTARNAISGAAWLKNKIRRAIGGSTSTLNTSSSTESSRRPSPGTYALVTNLSNATICASSLLLPSIKPLLDDRQRQIPKPLRKMHIPSVQVTPVRR